MAQDTDNEAQRPEDQAKEVMSWRRQLELRITYRGTQEEKIDMMKRHILELLAHIRVIERSCAAAENRYEMLIDSPIFERLEEVVIEVMVPNPWYKRAAPVRRLVRGRIIGRANEIPF